MTYPCHASIVLSCHASCHAPLSCPPSMPLPCPPVVPSLLPCPRRAFPVVRSCRPLPLPCPCRTFPVVHSFVRSSRARSLRNEIHWSALSCTTVVPVLTFPSPRHDGGTNFSPTLQSWGSAICAGPQANRKPGRLSFIFPNLLPLADIGEAQHRVKTSTINDDHFCPYRVILSNFSKLQHGEPKEQNRIWVCKR